MGDKMGRLIMPIPVSARQIFIWVGIVIFVVGIGCGNLYSGDAPASEIELINFVRAKIEKNQLRYSNVTGRSSIKFDIEESKMGSSANPQASQFSGFTKQELAWSILNEDFKFDLKPVEAPANPVSGNTVGPTYRQQRIWIKDMGFRYQSHGGGYHDAYIDPIYNRDIVPSNFNSNFNPKLFRDPSIGALGRILSGLQDHSLGGTLTASMAGDDGDHIVTIKASLDVKGEPQLVEMTFNEKSGYNLTAQKIFRNGGLISETSVVYESVELSDHIKAFFPKQYKYMLDINGIKTSLVADQQDVNFAAKLTGEDFRLEALGIEPGTPLFDRRYTPAIELYYGKIPTSKLDQLVDQLNVDVITKEAAVESKSNEASNVVKPSPVKGVSGEAESTYNRRYQYIVYLVLGLAVIAIGWMLLRMRKQNNATDHKKGEGL